MREGPPTLACAALPRARGVPSGLIPAPRAQLAPLPQPQPSPGLGLRRQRLRSRTPTPTGLQQVNKLLPSRASQPPGVWGQNGSLELITAHLQARLTPQAAAGWLKGQRKMVHLRKKWKPLRAPWGLGRGYAFRSFSLKWPQQRSDLHLCHLTWQPGAMCGHRGLTRGRFHVLGM